MKWLLSSLAVLAVVPRSRALNNGLARTPPMGWISWAKFYCQVLALILIDELLIDY